MSELPAPPEVNKPNQPSVIEATGSVLVSSLGGWFGPYPGDSGGGEIHLAQTPGGLTGFASLEEPHSLTVGHEVDLGMRRGDVANRGLGEQFFWPTLRVMPVLCAP